MGAGESIRHVLRPDGQPVHRRLPFQADHDDPPRRLLRQLRQAARRPRLRAAHHGRRPRLNRHRRHGRLRGRSVSGRLSRVDVRGQRDDQHHPSRYPRVAGLLAVGGAADRFRVVRRLVVSASRFAARARRRPLRGRLLQLHHRPLRGRPETSAPRPPPRSDLADRVEGGGWQGRHIITLRPHRPRQRPARNAHGE